MDAHPSLDADLPTRRLRRISRPIQTWARRDANARRHLTVSPARDPLPRMPTWCAAHIVIPIAPPTQPMRRTSRTLSTAAALVCLAAACAPRPAAFPAPVAGGQAWVEDRLYFGRGIAGGDSVTDAQWAEFLRERVTPRFPDGLTVFHAAGQWRNPDGSIQREGTLVLDLLHPGTMAADTAVEGIARDYETRFRQQSVLRVTTPATVRFVQ